MTYNEWAEDYGLRHEPNYNAFTEADCKAAWNAAEESMRAELAEAKEESAHNLAYLENVEATHRLTLREMQKTMREEVAARDLVIKQMREAFDSLIDDSIKSVDLQYGTLGATHVRRVSEQAISLQPTTEALDAYVAEAVAAEREAFIAQIQAEIDHAEINEMRLVAPFGKAQGEVAVRVGALEAALDAIRARGTA